MDVLLRLLNNDFDSALFRAELADLLGVPVDRVRITGIVEAQNRLLEVAIIDLTQAQATEVLAFFDDNKTFTLDGFGTVTRVGDDGAVEVAKPNDIVTLGIPDVCTSVSATDFPEGEYIQAFEDALASVASVTVSISFAEANSQLCGDATPAGTTQVPTNIQVNVADLGAVLDLLPTASDTIDLRGQFGVVSLGGFLRV